MPTLDSEYVIDLEAIGYPGKTHALGETTPVIAHIAYNKAFGIKSKTVRTVYKDGEGYFVVMIFIEYRLDNSLSARVDELIRHFV